jgi:hypothetical protein
MECPAASCVVSLYYFCQGRMSTVLLVFLRNGSRVNFLMIFRIHAFCSTLRDESLGDKADKLVFNCGVFDRSSSPLLKGEAARAFFGHPGPLNNTQSSNTTLYFTLNDGLTCLQDTERSVRNGEHEQAQSIPPELLWSQYYDVRVNVCVL